MGRTITSAWCAAALRLPSKTEQFLRKRRNNMFRRFCFLVCPFVSFAAQDRSRSRGTSAGASASVCQARAPREISAMSFAKTLDNLALDKSPLVRRFEQLIAPKSDSALEAMAQTSRALTLHNFGRTMRLFAPLYLSNECINN